MAINNLAEHLSVLCAPLSSSLAVYLMPVLAVAVWHLKVNMSKNGLHILTHSSFSPSCPSPGLPIQEIAPFVQDKYPGVILDSSFFFLPPPHQEDFVGSASTMPPSIRRRQLSPAPLPRRSSLPPLPVLHSPHSCPRNPFILLLKTPHRLPLRE